MKKIHALVILLFFCSFYSFSQDCITQRALSDDTICFGQSASIILSNSETGVNYQLRAGATDIGTPVAGTTGVDITFTVTPTTTTVYNVYVVECDITYTDIANVTVNPLPNAGTSGNTTVCDSSGASINLFSLISGEQTGGTWTRTSGTGGTFSAAAGTFTPATGATSSDFTYTLTGIAPCINDSSIATVNINPQPNAVATNATQTICSSNAIATMVLSGSVGSTTFNWTRDNSGTATGIAASGSGNISGNLTNTTNAAITVTFTITPTANGCTGTPITTTVLVRPTPDVIATNNAQTICSGSAIATMALSSSVTSTTFSWTRDNTGSVTGIAASGSGNISGNLTNTTNAPVTVTFTITPTANTCGGTPITATILVNPTPNVVATNATQTICSGVSIATMVLSGNVATTTFNWTRNNSGTVTGIAASGSGNISGNLTNTTNAAVTVTFTITPTANGCSGTPITTTVLVRPTPNTVATNNAQTICSGSAIATMVLSGSVGSTTFNWTRDNVAAVTGIAAGGNGNISGTLTNTTNAAITVTFTITPTANTCSGTPITTTVLVNPTPNVVATNNAQTICSGTSITTMVLSGNVASTTFNWTRNNFGSVTGIAASGSGNISGNLTNTTNASVTVTFTITPTANGCSGTPITTTVLVRPTPNAVATNNAQTICSGNAIVTMVLSGSVGSTTFNWTRDNFGTVTGIAASGSGNISGTLTNTTNAAITVTFTITPISNTCSGIPITTTVLVRPRPDVIATNNAQTICSGSAIATMALSSSVASTTFNWTRNNTGSVTGIAASGNGNISGTLTNTTNAPVTVTFTITPTANTCSGTPITATVLVNPIPNAVATNNAQTICSGASITTMALTGNVASTTFNWTRNNTGSVTGIAASGSGNISGTLTNTTNAAVTVTFTITPTANGCTGTPITTTVLVRPTPDAIATNNAQTICSGSAIATIALSSSVASTTFSWTRNNTGSVTGIAIGGSGNINGTLTNTTNAPVTVTFTITPTANTCSGTPITTTVLVNPIPNAVATNNTQTICSGASITTMILSGNVTSTTFNWTRNNTGSVTGIAASGSGNISGTLTNTTNAAVTVTFTITPSANGCSGTPITTTVLVNPTPNAVATNNAQTICSGASITVMALSGNVVSTTFNWTRDNVATVTGISASGSGNITGSLTNTTNTPITVTFTITPTANGCVGTPTTATVLVEGYYDAGAVTVSLPSVTPVVSITTVCHAASGFLYLNGHTGNIVRWESSTTGGASWITLANTNDSYNYLDIIKTTLFRAVIENGSAVCPEFYSAMAIVNVIPNIKPSPVAATPSTICAGDSSILTSESGYATSQNVATGGSFSNANPAGWLADGCGNCLNAGSSNTNPNPFQLSATNGGTYSGVNYASSGKFAIANGNFNSILQTPVFNTLGLTTANLSFDHAYNLLAGAWAKVEISLDGGATYNTILAQYNGPDTRTPYNAFPNTTIDLSSYLGQTNLRIRFNYHGTVGSSWAIDNIGIPDVPVNLTTQWVDSSTGLIISNTANVTVWPIITTTYAVTSFLNGCTSFGPEGTTYVTVTVNPRPTASIAADQTICDGGTATFSVTFTGTAPWRITYSNGATPTPTLTTVNNININPYVFSVTGLTTNKVYSITALSDAYCTAIPADFTGSASVTVLNGKKGLWTGLVSTDWFDCLNWEGGLPSSTIDADIPSGTPRMPIIDRTSPFAAACSFIANAQDLMIASGASVTMVSTNNSELQISRDWKNSGDFDPGTGTVTFNGATSNQVQTINAGIKIRETFYNLTLNNSNGAKGISVVDGFELTVSNNLSLLSGDLRLTGEAQLVQSGITANPAGGSGKLLRDQQGTKSSFHYNYWSSPVSTDNITYSIAGILKDGTDVTTSPFNPISITFGDGVAFADGAPTNPIKISNRWLFKYTAISNSYFSWQYIGSTGTLKIGEGYTMKGSAGTVTFLTPQNYVFVGKPNNGDITLNIALGQSYLIGNPYPSALNADEFILDNIKDKGGRAISNIFNGALYFWDHFGGQSHFLNEYVGGYATYTLMGGVVAIANDPLNINDGSTGIKEPKNFIPVAQGFFIGTNLDPSLTTNNPGFSTPITGGPVVFKNSQRAFKLEAVGSSLFFKTENNTVSSSIDDNRPKIKLKFDSPSGLQRQLLVGADNKTTTLFDIGYDAPMIDLNENDMYWELGNNKFVIQAIPDFNAGQVIPLGLKVSNIGLSTIKIDTLENVPDATEIYLYDNLTGIYHDIKNDDFTISLAIGEYNNRFSLRFTRETLNVGDNTINGIKITHIQNGNILIINNELFDTTVKKVNLFNLIGQFIVTWDVENEEQQNIQIPIKNLSAGTYIVKLQTSNGTISKKIIIKQ